jgi:hypothetical protein
MSEYDEEKVRRNVIRNVKEHARKHLPSKKMLFLFFLLGMGIGLVSVPTVINQAWAWQVANSMITINGLIIGFSILALTVFLRRGYSENLFKKLAEESSDNLVTDFKRLRENPQKISNEELMTGFVSNVMYPFVDVAIFRGAILISMLCSLVSIGSCLMLFGVSPERMSNPLSQWLFVSIYGFAISMFIYSAYYVFHGVSAIAEKATEMRTEEGYKIASEVLKRKLDEFIKENESKQK